MGPVRTSKSLTSDSASLSGNPRGTLAQLRSRLTQDFRIWADIRAVPALAIWGGLNCVAVLTLVGRAQHAPLSRISLSQFNLLVSAAAVLAVAARGMLARFERESPTAIVRGLAALAGAFPVLALWLSIPVRLGTAGAAYCLALAAISALAGAFWSRKAADDLLSAALSPMAQKALRPGNHPALDAAASHTIAFPGATRASEADRDTTLWIERRTLPAGDELIQGAARAEFATQQGVAVVHICFCPTLNRSPELTFETRDADGVRVKAAAVHAWGCRFELKRSGNIDEPRSVEIRFRAVACRRLAAA